MRSRLLIYGQLGRFGLKLHVKFMEVRAGEIDSEYEKIWISPKQWRTQFTSAEFNETSIGGDGQVWQSSNAQEKPLRVHEFERALAALSQTVVGEVKYAVREVPRRKTTRPSLSAHRQTTSNGPSFRIVLIPDTGLMLQVSELAADWVYTYSDYKPFAGKQFPRTIGVIEGSRAVADCRSCRTGSAAGLRNPSCSNLPRVLRATKHARRPLVFRLGQAAANW